MRANVRILCAIFFLSAFFTEVHPSLLIRTNSDVDHSKSSNTIAVATVGDSVTSEISMKAGKAPYYLIFDDDGLFIKSLTNPFQTRGRRASVGVVDLLNKESVRTVIAGKFGNKMKKLLEADNIEYHELTGIAQEVVKTILPNNTE